jgi:phage tail P2-like protein
MNRQDTILADSLAIFPHMMAFDIAAKEYLDDLHLEILLVYLVDQVDARALPLLGKQFNVMGYKGWDLCNTDAERRALIKKAIELHRYKGTIWAVKEALKSIGFTDVVITEHVNGHWARFSLRINNQVVTANGFADIIAMVEEYKNVRSVLDAVVMELSADDVIEFGDTDEAFIADQLLAEDIIYFSGSVFYDGSEVYDGSNDHSGDADTVTIT